MLLDPYRFVSGGGGGGPVGNVARVPAGDIPAQITETGDGTAGYTYTATSAPGTWPAVLGRPRKADASTQIGSTEARVFACTFGTATLTINVGVFDAANIEFTRYASGDLGLNNNAYSQFVNIPDLAASGGTDLWIRGDDWASQASHAASTLWRARIVGSTVRLDSSINSGTSWANLATYNHPSTPSAWQNNNIGMYQIGQAVLPSWM